jgi:acetyl/propionyl-CoA carboxylase alpha subunit
MEYRYRVGDEMQVVRIVERGERFEVRIGEQRFEVKARELDPTSLALWVDGQYHEVRHASQGDERWVAVAGEVHHGTRVRHRRRQHAVGEGQDTLTATMPGQIVAVLVAPGDEVTRGQTLVLMEAMKMELRVAAPHDGVVASLFVAEGEAVERGQTLVALK